MGCHGDVLVGEGSLRGGEARDRDAEGRARHVIEPDVVAELDRRRFAAVLTADAHRQVCVGGASALGADADELPDAVSIQYLERILWQDFLLYVVGQEVRGVRTGILLKHGRLTGGKMASYRERICPASLGLLVGGFRHPSLPCPDLQTSVPLREPSRFITRPKGEVEMEGPQSALPLCTLLSGIVASHSGTLTRCTRHADIKSTPTL